MTNLTMKFGGTSVGSAEAITQAAAIVIEGAQQWDHLVIVVSAMSGVTDALIRGARTATAADGGAIAQSSPIFGVFTVASSMPYCRQMASAPNFWPRWTNSPTSFPLLSFIGSGPTWAARSPCTQDRL